MHSPLHHSKGFATKPKRHSRFLDGFTLIEIGIVLAIIAVLTATTLPFFKTALAERRLREPANALRELVVDTRTKAMLSGTRHAIILDRSGFYPEADNLNEQTNTPTINGFSLTPPMQMECRMPGESDWRTPINDRWIIRSTGLVSPVSIRFVYRDDSLEIDFDALTGMVREERFYIQ